MEEFNVSLTQFVGNCHGNQDHLADVILSHELLLMQQLHYHLTVHNPYRPLEGLIIDVKVGILIPGSIFINFLSFQITLIRIFSKRKNF